MSSRAAIRRRPGSGRVATRTPKASRIRRLGRSRPRKVVVAVLDGGSDDAEVVDVALASCLSRRREMRLVYLYGELDQAPTPLVEAFALEYLRGALTVVHLVPAVEVSAVSIPWAMCQPLRHELADAELLVTSRARSDQVVDAGRPARAAGLTCRVLAVAGNRAGPKHMRFPYRLALQRELEVRGPRVDGATTPEALDDVWHVGIACPELSPGTLDVWAACSGWPPRSVASAATSGQPRLAGRR